MTNKEYQKATEVLEELAKKWPEDKLNFYGNLHTATPGESTEGSRLRAVEKLESCLGRENTEEALKAWEITSKEP